VADDHEETCEVTTEWLNHHGFETRVASTGLMALELARSISPSLVLLDIMMPEMNGLEVARVLKNDLATRGIPLVVMTASGRSEHEVHVDAIGCEGLLKKPVNLKELLDTVRSIIARKPSL